MQEDDKRKFSRTVFHGKGEILLGSRHYPVEVEDLSLKGVLVSCSEHFKLNEQVRFHLVLSGSDIVIETEGVIVHKHENEYGIKFTLIEAEGMIHLRSIMEYNTEKYSKIEDELFFLRETR